jgi:DNA-binding transcriptional LysR family regulator
MFADTAFDAALYAGTRSLRLLAEDVVPVCSPKFMGPHKALTPEAIAELPLLQQSTRAEAWRRWFDAMGVNAPLARSGPRFELFSMTAAAADRTGTGVRRAGGGLQPAAPGRAAAGLNG